MNEPEIALRTAGSDDAERLALVGAATFLETYAGNVHGDDVVAYAREAHSPAACAALLAEPDARAWLAEVAPGGAPIGYAVLTGRTTSRSAASTFSRRPRAGGSACGC